jgi:hypothetical protein
MIDKIIKFLSRLFFFVAMLLLIIAFIDGFLRLWGWKFSWLPYDPGRLLEFTAIFMIIVIAFLLRQIRNAIKS